MLAAASVAGLPPLPGFIGKFAMLSALLDAPVISPANWSFLALLLLSGFLTLVALSRAGIRYFWTQPMSSMPALRVLEVLPVAALLAASVALSIEAGPIMHHASDTARDLYKPHAYRNAVMGARQVPNPPVRKVSP